MSTHIKRNSFLAVVIVVARVFTWGAHDKNFWTPNIYQRPAGEGGRIENPSNNRESQYSSFSETLGQWKLQDTISGEEISMISATNGWMVDFNGYNCYLYHWDGNTWTASGVIPHPNYYQVYGGDIQMVSSSDGWLMFWGDYYGPPYYPPASVIYRWDGEAWNFFKSLGGSGSGIAMGQMDILSSTDIWAVAGTMVGTKYFHWDGSDWTLDDELCCDIAIDDDIDMVTPSSGWSVGYSGIANWNGVNWSEATSPTSSQLQSISMVSDTNGWIVGSDGVILHWNNGWSEVTTPVTTTLISIAMLSDTNGWTVGDSGVILHWDGNTWSQVPSPTTSVLNEIIMVSADDGWIVGQGVVLRYDPSELSSNYQTGQPGSFFNITGSSYPPNCPVDVSINGVELTSTISTNSTGVFTFTLSTTQADPGRYEVTASVNPSATTSITLAPTEPLRQKEGDWIILDISGGIALKDIFLPIILK